ncbi:MAG: hypothetical protein HY720_08690 [Planctomycetes bacterium]|nr:hypothetical protein [Planctomycetota bacterium]
MVWKRSYTFRLIWVVALSVPVLWLATKFAPAQEGDQADNKYIGASECKKCHSKEANGNQHAQWLETKHAKAFQNLATDEAKEQGRAKGVDDPQKSDQCLKCHTTGHGMAAELFKKGFDPALGVQCESCHGPGANHRKARLMSEETEGRAEIPEGEIVRQPPLETCLGCHNEESPQFKPFCYKMRVKEIAHFDPRKEHAANDCACPADACACKQGECSK